MAAIIFIWYLQDTINTRKRQQPEAQASGCAILRRGFLYYFYIDIPTQKLAAELSSIQQTEFQKNRDAADAYIDWMNSSTKLLDMGFSKEEIDTAGRNITGYTGPLYYDFGDEAATIGGSIVDGMAYGIEMEKEAAETAAGNLAKDTLGIVNSILGIHSPSKEFAKVWKPKSVLKKR